MKNHLYTNEELLGQDFPTILFEKLQLPRDRANMCEVNRPESVQLFQLKFPNPRNISPPIDGSKGT